MEPARHKLTPSGGVTVVCGTLRERIGLFTSVVGGLQHIQAPLPLVIEATVLGSAGAGDEIVRNVEISISEAQATVVDLYAFANDELDDLPRPEAAPTLADLPVILEKLTLPERTRRSSTSATIVRAMATRGSPSASQSTEPSWRCTRTAWISERPAVSVSYGLMA